MTSLDEISRNAYKDQGVLPANDSEGDVVRRSLDESGLVDSSVEVENPRDENTGKGISFHLYRCIYNVWKQLSATVTIDNELRKTLLAYMDAFGLPSYVFARSFAWADRRLAGMADIVTRGNQPRPPSRQECLYDIGSLEV